MNSFTRAGRRWLATAVLAALLSSGCTSNTVRFAPAGSGQPSTGASSAPAWGGQLCSRPDVSCTSDQGLPVMALTHTGRPVSKFLLVDVGGPGISVENAVEQVTDAGLWPRYDVLIVGESWELAAPPADCLAAESARLASFRTLSDKPCDAARWSFDAGAYQRAVQHALTSRHAGLLAAVGVSFGAVRVARATPASVPLVLITPAPPSGDFAAVAAARSAAITTAAAKACGTGAGCTRALAALGRPELDDHGYQTALALIASATNPVTFTRVARSLAGGSRALSDADLTRLAYAATYRYADAAVLPNLLSYRGGTCGQYGGAVRPAAGGLETTLQRVLACPDAAAAVGPVLTGRKGCVFVADDDLVTPKALTAPWTQAGSGLRLATGRVEGHGRLDGTAAGTLERLPGSLASC